MYYLNIVFTLWNIVIFILYGVDKFKASKNLYRISELTLILPAFILAAPGALFGMVVFNHKTSKMKFRLLIPLAFILNLICYNFLTGYIKIV